MLTKLWGGFLQLECTPGPIQKKEQEPRSAITPHFYPASQKPCHHVWFSYCLIYLNPATEKEDDLKCNRVGQSSQET